MKQKSILNFVLYISSLSLFCVILYLGVKFFHNSVEGMSKKDKKKMNAVLKKVGSVAKKAEKVAEKTVKDIKKGGDKKAKDAGDAAADGAAAAGDAAAAGANVVRKTNKKKGAKKHTISLGGGVGKKMAPIIKIEVMPFVPPTMSSTPMKYK